MGDQAYNDGEARSWAYFDGITVVPIPAAAWLLGSGLFGMAAVRRIRFRFGRRLK